VKVYKNATLLGTIDASGRTYAASGGHIGVWTVGASGTQFDDFGGGRFSRRTSWVTTTTLSDGD
jgi:hypothetical protein